MTDYDSAWKEICDDFFGEMLTFFLPNMHTAIDWNEAILCRDKELAKLAEDHETGDRLADKLLDLHMRGATPKNVLVHIEFQNQYDAKLPSRMYTYNYRVFDKFQVPVLSLAFLGDRSKSWRPNCYQVKMLGFDLKMTYEVIKLIDYRDQSALLETSPNPMAMVLAAHFAGQETLDDAMRRFDQKLSLAARLYERNFTRATVINLFRFIDRVMPLPPQLTEQFRRELEVIEGAVNMPYITSIERLGYERGHEEGREQERENGRLSQVENLTLLLTHRFGPLPDTVIDRIQQADIKSLKSWFVAALTIPDLGALFSEGS